MKELASIGPKAPDAARLKQLTELIEVAWKPDSADARTRAMAQRSLLDEPDVDWAFEAGLSNPDPAVRSQCAYQLGERHRAAAIPLLLVRIRQDEKDGNVECWMIDALSRLGCLGAVDRLPALLAYEPTMQTAGTLTIGILERLGRHPGGGTSYAQLADAASALWQDWRRDGVVPSAVAEPAPTVDSIEPLYRQRLASWAAALAESDLRPVDNGRWVFERIGRTALPFLPGLLHAQEDYVRRYGAEIADALGRTATVVGPDLQALLGDTRTASLAARALGSIGYRPATPYLIERLLDASPEMRVAAADGLGLMGDDAGFDPLRARLGDTAETDDVKVHAAWALALLSPGDRYLLQRLRDKSYHEPTLLELLDSVRAIRR